MSAVQMLRVSKKQKLVEEEPGSPAEEKLSSHFDGNPTFIKLTHFVISELQVMVIICYSISITCSM